MSTRGIRSVLGKGWRTAGRNRNQARTSAAASHSQHPGPNRLGALEPQFVRRHRKDDILLEQRDEFIHVIAFEGSDIAAEHFPLIRRQLSRAATAGGE